MKKKKKMQQGSSGPYCLTNFGALEIRKDAMEERDAKEADKIRVAFSSQYEDSAFSRAFLTDQHLAFVFDKLRGIDTGDLNIAAEVIQFVVTWDDERGYDGSAEMLKQSRDTFLFNINKQAEKDAWDLRMQVVNQGMQTHCTERRKVRDSYVEVGDMTRQEGADRVRSHVSAALRCRVFGAPKAKTDDTVDMKSATRMKELMGIQPGQIISTRQTWRDLARKAPPPVCEAGPVPQDLAPRGRLAGTPVLYHNVRDFHYDVVASQRH
ncbi:MAG: hypothetical protein CL450_07355 [Acidimicrobiaceae bacterium]|nr:hypothetical protein [Acidimicrobiaceae bacterium]